MEHAFKILLVASDPTMRALLVAFLKNQGYDVRVAASDAQVPQPRQREDVHGGAADAGKTLSTAVILIVHAEPPHLQYCARPANIFRQEGDYWTIAYARTVLRLKDTKGRHCISHLLRWPRKKFHVLHLPTAAEAWPASPTATRRAGVRKGPPVEPLLRVSRLGDAGPKLDPQAKRAYKSRRDDLRDALEETQRCRDVARATKVQAEIDWIARELAAAYGLGDRIRGSSDGGERARKAVTNRIKDSFTKIQQAHPSLWPHRVNGIRTGTFRAYIPEQPTAWHL